MKNSIITVENSIAIPKKLNTELPYDPAIPILNVYPKELKAGTQNRYLYTHVQSSIIHNSPKVESTQVSIDRRCWGRDNGELRF